VTVPEYVLVLTTLPVNSDAEAFAFALIDDRLAACVNVAGEMTSVFRWGGRVERERERQLIIKTTGARLPALMDRLRERHPYEVPEILAIPVVDGSAAYLQWVSEVTI
jgi:periplasmic divalent cation tolerance protein